MKPKYLLQIGLAFVLLFAGLDALIHPFNWLGFVPAWLGKIGPGREFALKAHAVFEIALGLWLLSNWKLRIASGLAALDVLGIIFGNGIGYNLFLVTFRDVSIFLTALYLAWDQS